MPTREEKERRWKKSGKFTLEGEFSQRMKRSDGRCEKVKTK